MFNRATIVLQLYIRVCSPIFPLNFVTAKRHCRYRGITAFPITVLSSSLKAPERAQPVTRWRSKVLSTGWAWRHDNRQPLV